MSQDLDYARLRWSCRRGMLELDLLLLPFFEHTFKKLPLAEKALFERLLACNDQELYDWFITNKIPADVDLARMINRIRHYAQHKN